MKVVLKVRQLVVHGLSADMSMDIWTKVSEISGTSDLEFLYPEPRS